MKTLTIAFCIAQVLSNTLTAQVFHPMTDEAIAARIAEEASAELGLANESLYRLECRIASRNEGMAGTGAALVMYAPARAHLVVAFDLVSVKTGSVIRTGEAHVNGRNSMDEAIEEAVERISMRNDLMPTGPGTPGPVNVIARTH